MDDGKLEGEALLVGTGAPTVSLPLAVPVQGMGHTTPQVIGAVGIAVSSGPQVHHQVYPGMHTQHAVQHVVQHQTAPGVAVQVPAGTQVAMHAPPPMASLDDVEENLVEVREAMKEANEVFNRVKSEKIAEQALCSIRNDQQQYEGLAKEIVGKAIKQKERERANRASAAASRAKVMRYQTELESRLNRVESERNSYRKDNGSLKVLLARQQAMLQKLEQGNPDYYRSMVADDDIGLTIGEKRKSDIEEEVDAKKRRM